MAKKIKPMPPSEITLAAMAEYRNHHLSHGPWYNGKGGYYVNGKVRKGGTPDGAGGYREADYGQINCSCGLQFKPSSNGNRDWDVAEAHVITEIVRAVLGLT